MNPARFVALDSWRGLCALIVVLFHFPVEALLAGNPLVKNGYLFVDFFFVLSGFVIATAYDGRLDGPLPIWRFLIRRFGRLWPLHIVTLAAFVLASWLKGEIGADERHSVESLWTNLFMIHGLGVHDDLTWNGPSWSISVEWLLYLLFALLAAVPGRRWFYAAFALCGAAALLLFAPYGAASSWDFGAYRGLAGFFVGALIRGIPRRTMGGGAEVVAVTLALAFVAAGQVLFLSPLVFALAVYVFAWSDGPLSKALHWTPLVRLGEWSYSTYMVHSLVVAAVWAGSDRIGLTPVAGALAGPIPLTLALLAAYLAATIAISYFTYSWVEAPGRRWFKRLASPSARAVVI